MCGRYVIQWLPDEISERFQLRRIPASLFESFNAAPAQELPVILELENGDRELRTMRWGLIPRWAKPGDKKAIAPINARRESVLEKPMFRSLMNRKRCLVPANGYYEWKQIGGRKQPYLFTVNDQEIFAFAGLYDEFTNEEGELTVTYTIITAPANPFAAEYHLRMPVILTPDAEDMWVSQQVVDGHAVEHLLRPYPGELMSARPVSPAVNNVRNNYPGLIDPIDGGSPDDEDGHSQRPLL